MPKGDYLKGKGPGYLWLKDHVGHQGDECLIWPFSRSDTGYGQLGYLGKIVKAHRLMCTLVKGTPPSSIHEAAHDCGNGNMGCIHPRHLFWKTSAENAADRRRHGRPEGGNGTRTYLTPEQVAEIRASKGHVAKREIAKKFGISRGSVEYWWRHDREPLPFAMDSFNIKRRNGYYRRSPV